MKMYSPWMRCQTRTRADLIPACTLVLNLHIFRLLLYPTNLEITFAALASVYYHLPKFGIEESCTIPYHRCC